jgi:hypothetical protein
LVLLCVACSKSVSHGNETLAHCPGGAAPVELTLERALPIEGARGLEPSGLLMSGGKLLMVSDKHDDAIFVLSLGTDVAVARPFVTIVPPSPAPLDLEGLAAGPNGSWLLASEAQYRVLQVTPDGQSRFLTPSLRELGARAGLFQKPNAGLEGIVMRDGALLLAAEREPRGLLESDLSIERWQTFAMPSSACPAPPPRSNDFADLSVDGARTFALVRNAHLIVELQKRDGAWHEAAAHSYGRTENDPRFAYADRRFGLAEGLAFDSAHVYVALDNNADRRAAAASDRRPLLFVFRRPG